MTLVEQDEGPDSPDDLIGEVKVKLKNEKGALQVNWSMPNRIDAPTQLLSKDGFVQRFELQSESARYQLFLRLDE